MRRMEKDNLGVELSNSTRQTTNGISKLKSSSLFRQREAERA
jgi:hypothetical protein